MARSCEAEAATFNPFIYCQGERTVPSGLCVFGFREDISAGRLSRFRTRSWIFPSGNSYLLCKH